MKNSLVQAGVEGFKDSFRLVIALVVALVAVVAAFADHKTMNRNSAERPNHDSQIA